MKKMYLYNTRICLLAIILVAVLTGCGKEKNVSATTNKTQNVEVTESPVTVTEAPVTITEAPVNTATATPTPIEETTPVINHSTEYIYARDFELTKEEEEFLAKLERTHLIPFLGQYRITEKYVDYTGAEYWGNWEYEITVCCERGKDRLTLVYRAYIGSFNPNVEEDVLFYDTILLERQIAGEWEIIGDYERTTGLQDHIN